MPQAFYILFGAAFTAVVSVCSGRLLLRGLKVELHRREETLLAFMTGSALLSAAVFALASLGLVRKGYFLAAGLLIIALSVRQGRGRPAAPALPALPRFWDWLFGGVFAVFSVLYLLNAMAPETSPDGSAYHLGLVARYYREHGFRRLDTNMYGNLSQGVEMLFLYAYAWGRHSAAALVHFWFLLALPLMMVCYGRRFGFPAAGAAGALFFFVSPVAGIDGTSAYNDVAVAAIVFGVFYLLRIWDETRDPRLFVPIGLLAGFGYAAKYTAFLAVPYALGFIGWKLLRGRKPILKPLLIISLCAFVMMAPWMVKNLLWIGNPFSPFFNKFFPNPYVSIAFEQEYSQYMRNYSGLPSRWAIPLEITVRGHLLCGLFGPLFLLAPLSLLALRHKAGRHLLLAAVVFGLPYAANIGTRFLLPAAPFVSLALALAFSGRMWIAGVLAAAHAAASWPSVIPVYSDVHAWRLRDVPFRQALRIESEEWYLTNKFPPYLVARMIEDFVPPGVKVLTFNQVAEAYTSRDILVVYQSARNAVLGTILWTPIIPDFQPVQFLEFKFPAELLRKVRVVQTGGPAVDQWAVSEFRVFADGRELERAPDWRLRARPNPWNVQMAFDNSPVTQWHSAEPIAPAGMYVEIEFSAAQRVDLVRLECKRDQPYVKVRLEGEDAAGNWKTLAGEPRKREVSPPFGLRRLAADELKRAGVRFILAQRDDIHANDLLAKPELWGVVRVAERGDTGLYRVE